MRIYFYLCRNHNPFFTRTCLIIEYQLNIILLTLVKSHVPEWAKKLLPVQSSLVQPYPHKIVVMILLVQSLDFFASYFICLFVCFSFSLSFDFRFYLRTSLDIPWQHAMCYCVVVQTSASVFHYKWSNNSSKNIDIWKYTVIIRKSRNLVKFYKDRSQSKILL
jgi:hypothetical protein